MELTREIYDRIKAGVQSANLNQDYEFECVFSNHLLNKEVFDNIREYLQYIDIFKLDQQDDRDTLDISLMNSNYRVSIEGKNAKEEYCETGTLTDFVLMEKKPTDYTNVRLNEYNVYFKIKDENVIQPDEEFNELFSLSTKFFRSKRRFSFLHKSELFRVDMTLVRASKDLTRNVKGSGVLSANDQYEVEIEYLNTDTNRKKDVNEVIEQLIDIIGTLLKIIDDTDNLMSNSQKELTLCGYLSMVNPKVFQDCNMEKMEYIKKIVMKKPKSFFLSYQPVTLEQTNLLEQRLGRLSIQEGYSVTEKADGERMLLYVNPNNNIYLIDSRLNVRDTGAKHKTPNCILDGEYVKESKFKTLLKQYMVFDIYFMNGKDVRDYKLSPTRITKMKEFCDNFVSSKLKIKAKTYHIGTDIFALSQKVYNKDKYDYHIDGLIYTPTELAVGTYYKEEESDKDTFGSTWMNVMKWKPPEENSIDMLTTYGKDVFVPEYGRCKLCSLQVAYKSNTDELIDPIKVLTNKEISNRTTYIAKEFKSIYLKLDGNSKKPKTMNGEYIYNNTIVEYIYDSKKPDVFSWIPYRVRYDKTELYQNTKNIFNTANTYTTAMNVWRSIQSPVTTDMITGKEKLNEGSVNVNNVYYARNVSRSKILSKPMLIFHNKGIKSRLYSLFKNKRYNLIELACGKAGDLFKWIENKYTFVLGMDDNLDNLMNSYDGAYKRYYQMNVTNKNNIKALFLQKDISKSWMDRDEIENKTMNQLYDIAWGKVKQYDIEDSKMMNYYDIMNKQFDVVSCQFAIHYMFENDERLDTFCDNLNKLMKVGSYFIGTCLDGNLVHKLLDKSVSGIRQGDINGNIVWMLQKKYDEYKEKETGNKISVYLESINRVYDEYLVDTELLKEKLKTYDIELLNDKDLKELDLTKSMDTFDKWYDANEYPFNDVLKEYSFLNTWFVFKKYK